MENEKLMYCSQKHNNQPIVSVVLNEQIPASQRLLCASCISEQDRQYYTISYQQAKAIISQKQEQLQKNLNTSIRKTQAQLQQFQITVDSLKSNIVQQFDTLLKNSQEWAHNLVEFQKQKCEYNLLKEIENLDQTLQYQEEKLMYELEQFNYSYYKKLEILFQIDGLTEIIFYTQDQIHNLHSDFQMPQKSIEIKKWHEHDTPHLDLKCTTHNSQIIQVDLGKKTKKEDRLKCISCKREESVTVIQFQQQWNQYQNTKQQQFTERQSQQKKRLKDTKDELYKFIVDLAEMIRNTFTVFEKSDELFKTKFMDTSLDLQLINMAEQLSQVENGQVIKDQEEEFQKKNEEGLNKLNSLSQQIGKAFETLQFQSTRQKSNQSKKKIAYQMIDDSVIQQETCRSISFNHDGSIMAAACDNNIKIWKFEKGKMEKVIAILQGHTNRVFCMVYSKSRNWIISGGNDTTIRLWKDMENNQWISPEPGKMHTSFVYCLLMNAKEDQLLSGSDDKSIKIWKVNYETNQLIYDYQLDKHQDRVYQMSLNESETALVSCSKDKQIIVWGIGQNQKWEFKYKINKNIDDFGRRICFINDEMIAWQQHTQGFTHFFKAENGKFTGKTEFKIQLKSSKDEGTNLFPIVFNKQYQFLISKHNKYVYIIRNQHNGKFNIECDPIDCYSGNNYGGLSNDGQYLVIWNEFTKQFRVFRFIFE